MYIQARTMTENAAREGVRVASLEGTMATGQADAVAAAKNAVSSLYPVPLVVVVCKTPGGVTCTMGTTGAATNVATVTVTLAYTGITGIIPSTWIKPIIASSYMRIEG